MHCTYMSDVCMLKSIVDLNFSLGIQTQVKLLYTHLSNRREVTLTEFEKFHPPQKKIPPSSFINFITIYQPPRLFQPPHLVIWQFLPPLHVYSNLHGY